MTDRWVVLGLGNPGAKYEGTRHNVGATAVRRLATAAGERLRAKRRARCEVATIRVGDAHVVLAVPQSYMNESGGPAAAVLGYHSVDPSRLVVVHDEIDLPFGTLRLKFGGGDNGHNGLKSIRSALGNGDWYRVRVGIGRGRSDAADHVLSGFTGAERKVLPDQLDRVGAAVEVLVGQGLAVAQNMFND